MGRYRDRREAHEELVAAVFRASYPRLVAQLSGMTRDRTEAEEVVQEAFARAVAAGPGWREVRKPEAWLRTVAINVLRSRARRTALLRRLTPVLSTPTAPADDGGDGEHVALLTALRSLPRDQREVLALRYFADLRVADIAAELGIAEGTVKSRLARGRQALARLLPSDGPDDVEEVDRGRTRSPYGSP